MMRTMEDLVGLFSLVMIVSISSGDTFFADAISHVTSWRFSRLFGLVSLSTMCSTSGPLRVLKAGARGSEISYSGRYSSNVCLNLPGGRFCSSSMRLGTSILWFASGGGCFLKLVFEGRPLYTWRMFFCRMSVNARECWAIVSPFQHTMRSLSKLCVLVLLSTNTVHTKKENLWSSYTQLSVLSTRWENYGRRREDDSKTTTLSLLRGSVKCPPGNIYVELSLL